VNLYQCRKCGWEVGVAEFMKSVTVICRCGHEMDRVATGKPVQGIDKLLIQK